MQNKYTSKSTSKFVKIEEGCFNRNILTCIIIEGRIWVEKYLEQEMEINRNRKNNNKIYR